MAVDDPDSRHGRASEAAATIECEVNETDRGSREYTARDPEGKLWSFGTYRPEAGSAQFGGALTAAMKGGGFEECPVLRLL